MVQFPYVFVRVVPHRAAAEQEPADGGVQANADGHRLERRRAILKLVRV